MEIETNEPEVNNVDPEITNGAAEIINAASSDPEPSEPVADLPASEAPEGEPAPWEPDYKFKVRDEEHNMDDWVKGLAKDEETFKKFQDLYTRGHGLELAKTERDDFKTKFNTLEESLGTVSKLVQDGNIEGFIGALGLPKKLFIDYAINELKFQELPPEEQQRINAQRQQQMQMQTLTSQNQQLQSNYERQQEQLLNNELTTTIGSQYQNEAQVYDSRTGVPGSFRQLVIERGIFHAKVNGQNIPVNQAIEEAVKIAGLSGTNNHSQPVSGTNTVNQKQKPKVLPNIQGQGTSPVKTTFTDIASLKAHRKEKYGH